jgi:NTP pyrophosphatase (non-canonical NTP hydrolase)
MVKTFYEYQKKASLTAIYPPKYDIVYPAMGLSNESGEVLGKIKKWIRDGGELDHEAVGAEIGDVLWYMALLATDLGLDLDDIAQGNLDKLASRMERGKISGSGDNR